MREGISGEGQLWHRGDYVCTVTYELSGLGDPEDAPSFTLTDGVVEVVEEEAQDPAVRARLETYEPLELVLAEPLADGRERLPIRIEPYQGHRPDERYQVRLRQSDSGSAGDEIS